MGSNVLNLHGFSLQTDFTCISIHHLQIHMIWLVNIRNFGHFMPYTAMMSPTCNSTLLQETSHYYHYYTAVHAHFLQLAFSVAMAWKFVCLTVDDHSKVFPLADCVASSLNELCTFPLCVGQMSAVSTYCTAASRNRPPTWFWKLKGL